MVKLLPLILLLVVSSSNAALEDWSCGGIANYYGNVAIDRDSGVELRDRVNKTVKAIITVMDSEAAPLDVEADDAQELVRIVYEVYESQMKPREVKRDALVRCLRGDWWLKSLQHTRKRLPI